MCAEYMYELNSLDKYINNLYEYSTINNSCYVLAHIAITRYCYLKIIEKNYFIYLYLINDSFN
jgi:hypothetical protein